MMISRSCFARYASFAIRVGTLQVGAVVRASRRSKAALIACR